MKTRVVVLAAGKGKRMGGEIPKVLIPFRGKPLIEHLLQAIQDSGVDARPVVVVGENGDRIKQTLSGNYEYVIQKEPLGTGHAVQATEELLRNQTDYVVVIYGDHPFLTPETIKNLDELHKKKGGPLAMMTTTVQDFNDWRFLFKDFSRIIRNDAEEIIYDIQVKDATPEELKVKEVNPCFFSFQGSWLWEHLRKLKNENKQKEYYLTDLVKMAIDEGYRIHTIQVSPIESVGINTPEQLAVARDILEKESPKVTSEILQHEA